MHTKAGFGFASQVKAIVASGLAATEMEPAGIAGFYLWGSVPEPWTIYSGIMALRAGNWIRVRGGKPQVPVSWHDIGESWRTRQAQSSDAEIEERVRNTVVESVRAHLVSDVHLSVFLSGGVDSGVVAGIISQLGAKAEGNTIGFEEFYRQGRDEVPLAAMVSSHYGLNHHVRQVTRSEFESDLSRILDAMDQPTIDGVNTWFDSKAVAERGYKVVLSGVGGDELFYDYPLVKEIPFRARIGRPIARIPGMRRLLSSMVSALHGERLHPNVRGIPEFMGYLEGGVLSPARPVSAAGFTRADGC